MKRSMMQRRFWVIVVLILCAQIVLSPLAASEAQARTQVTITFAAGGVVCGIFVFLQFTLRSSWLQNAAGDDNALLNKGEEGWIMAVPFLTATSLQGSEMGRPELAGERLEMELLKIRF